MTTQCYDVFWNDGLIFYFERHDLYSLPEAFFKRLSRPYLAEKQHRQNQREWLQDENTYEFTTGDKRVFYRCRFDHDEVSRQIVIENFPNRKRVDLND